MMDLDAARRAVTEDAEARKLLEDPPPWGLADWGWVSDGHAWLYMGPPDWLAGEATHLDPIMAVVDQAGNVELSTYMAQRDRLEFAVMVGEPPRDTAPDLLARD